MPQMADITVKKNDGTTDIVYVAKQPSAGDRVSAVWRSDANAAPYAGLKPEFKLSSRSNADGSVRRCDFVGAYTGFATDSTTTISSAIGKVTLQGTVSVSQTLPAADINEGVSQLTNLIVSALMRQCLKDGFAPT